MDKKWFSGFMASVCLALGLGFAPMSHAEEAQPVTPALSVEQGTSVEHNQKETHESREGKVDLNTATLDELMALKGVGKKKAQAIIDYREKLGRFTSVDQLENVFGIGMKLIDQNRDAIFVS